ncbi:MAG: DNA helicase [Candidatus Liberibacter ctenarytainae]|uniref:DNA 5'-3' helicase n=1 Tax=Candidatus Liberibacter ctenarytainae TaxID=2020335 RepID=A0A937DLV0_9HYPH|nr:DNA helicase [Candidatus Liberibacter ctenarytainae]
MENIETNFFIEFEQEILGAILLGGDVQPIISFLDAKHFIEPIHSELFRAILLAQERFAMVNPFIVKRIMDADIISHFENKAKIPLSTYLTNLLTSTSSIGPEALNAARRVVEQWGRVTLSHKAKKLAADTADPRCNSIMLTRDCMQDLEDIISEVSLINHQNTSSSCTSLSTAAKTALQAAIQNNEEDIQSHPKWGLQSIDSLTGGVQGRELILIGARPSMGKTTFALSLALRMAMNSHGVAFFSLEMDREKLAARALSDLLYDTPTRIPYIDLIRGEMNQSQQQSLLKACHTLHDLPLMIDDHPSPGIVDIRIRSERMAAQAAKFGHELQVIIIDHLSLIRPSNRYQGNRTYEIAETTSTLKVMARELNVAVILLSQLNRSVENRTNKIPQLADLRDSGALEQDADTIAFLYRKAYYLAREHGGSSDDKFERRDQLERCENRMDFILAKQRNGPIESLPLFVDMPFSAIRNEQAS